MKITLYCDPPDDPDLLSPDLRTRVKELQQCTGARPEEGPPRPRPVAAVGRRRPGPFPLSSREARRFQYPRRPECSIHY